MPWTVTTNAKVLDELIEIFLDASDQSAVSQASDVIDAKLRSAPLAHGTPRGRERILCELPLGVIYSVDPGNRLVEIEQYYCVG
jgi:hypothetical protein